MIELIAIIIVVVIFVFVVTLTATILTAIIKFIRSLFTRKNLTVKTQSPKNIAYSRENKSQDTNQGMPHRGYDLSSLEELVIGELQHYNKISAMKLVREKTGCSLYYAKEYVENLEVDFPIYEQFQEATKSTDISSVDGMDGHAFEYYCANLLRKNGFVDVSVTPGSGDQGVDILATKDDVKYAIQCKNYASTLGNTSIQEVSAGKMFYNCHIGVVLTNSTFTPKAIELAKATGVLLWDRKKLQELMTTSNPAPKIDPNEQQNTISQAVVPTAQPNTEYDSIIFESITPSPAVSTSCEVDSLHLRDTWSSFSNGESASITEVIEDVKINIHVGSATAANLIFSNLGIEKDDDPDDLTLLLDVEAKTGHSIPDDITIVCNAFSDNHKLSTEYHFLSKNSFTWKDSLELYFYKKNIAKKTTRIDIFCKRM